MLWNISCDWHSVDSRALPMEKNSKNRFPNENAYFRWHGTDCRKCRRSTAAGENATVIRGTDTRITCKELLFPPFQIYWPIQKNTKDGFICVDGQIWRPNQRMIRAKQDWRWQRFICILFEAFCGRERTNRTESRPFTQQIIRKNRGVINNRKLLEILKWEKYYGFAVFSHMFSSVGTSTTKVK